MPILFLIEKDSVGKRVGPARNVSSHFSGWILGWVIWSAPPKINPFGIRIHPVKYQVEIQRSHP